MLCDYGCSKESKFTLKNGKNCCSKRPAGCTTLKQINAEKTKQAHADGRHGYTYNAASAWTHCYATNFCSLCSRMRTDSILASPAFGVVSGSAVDCQNSWISWCHKASVRPWLEFCEGPANFWLSLNLDHVKKGNSNGTAVD